MTSQTLPSAAPASYSALYGFIKTLADERIPPVYVVQGDLQEFEPATYIVIEGVFDDEYAIEQTGYGYIETFNIEGFCTVIYWQRPDRSSGENTRYRSWRKLTKSSLTL